MGNMREYELAGIEVIARGVCAVDGKLLLCKAKGGKTTYLPGGHIEFGETGRQALVREIHEEMNASVAIERYLCTAEHDYEAFHLSMRCYVCSLGDSGFELLEHHAAKWLSASHLDEVKWLPADIQVVSAIKAAHVI